MEAETSSRSLPSPALLRELLDYNPHTGDLTWRPRAGKWASRWNKRYAGQRAGTVTPDGYVMIKVHSRNIPAHSAIAAILTGEWLPRVRHQNGDRADNRMMNLSVRALPARRR